MGREQVEGFVLNLRSGESDGLIEFLGAALGRTHSCDSCHGDTGRLCGVQSQLN